MYVPGVACVGLFHSLTLPIHPTLLSLSVSCFPPHFLSSTSPHLTHSLETISIFFLSQPFTNTTLMPSHRYSSPPGSSSHPSSPPLTLPPPWALSIANIHSPPRYLKIKHTFLPNPLMAPSAPEWCMWCVSCVCTRVCFSHPIPCSLSVARFSSYTF